MTSTSTSTEFVRHVSPETACPLCGGYDRQERGRGIRCSGKHTRDGRRVGCSREEHAGHLTADGGGLYWHWTRGRCTCGVQHGPADTNVTPAPSRVVAEYEYRDAAGQLAYVVERREPKTFRQRRPDGKGGWIWSLAGVGRLPYRLPELQAADPTVPVLILEGEKDVDRAGALGFVASCNSEGAEKFRPELAPHFANRHIVLIPDNDEKGERHIDQVAALLLPVAASLRVVRLPGLPPKGDFSDWVSAGGTAAALQALIEAAPNWLESKAVRILQDELQKLRARAEEAERRCAELERRNFVGLRLQQNKATKKYAPVIMAIASTKDSAISRGADPADSVLVRRKELGRLIGAAPKTVSNHLRAMEGKGWIKREYEDHPPGTAVKDYQTGEANDEPMSDLFLKLPADVDVWLDGLLATLPDQPERRGGTREPCPHCGIAAPRTTKHTTRCDACNHVLDERVSHSDRHKDLPPSDQWATTAPAANPATDADPLANFARGDSEDYPSSVINASPMAAKFARGDGEACPQCSGALTGSTCWSCRDRRCADCGAWTGHTGLARCKGCDPDRWTWYYREVAGQASAGADAAGGGG